jgi:hypothetical protein
MRLACVSGCVDDEIMFFSVEFPTRFTPVVYGLLYHFKFVWTVVQKSPFPSG